MPTFQYEALNAAGQSIKAELDAGSSDEAISKIKSQGYFPMKIREKSVKRKKGADTPEAMAAAATSSGKKKKKGFGEISINIGRVSQKLLTQFTRQLSTLQDAGLPILRSLKVLFQQQKPGMMKDTLDSICEAVEGGSTLSEAMSRHPKVFDKLYCNMVQAGETGGVLDIILQRLAEFMEKAQKLKRRLKGAMIYPCVVVSFAILMVTGIMVFVIPKFETLFAQFKTGLPTITVDLMMFSNWMANEYGWAYIISAPFVIWILLKATGKTKPGRLVLDYIRLKIPVMGKIVTKSTIARFTRTLGTLLAAGVPILEAISITRDTCGNMIYERALQKVHDAIREGEGFSTPLRNARVCDAIVVNMIDVGEETGDMDKMLMKIADNYDEEVDVLVSSMVSILEPIMIVVLGGIVGFIVLAVFLPYVKLLQSIGGGGTSGS
ncbi:MAG TPA: type II secretion system F family protein [Phycisphaerae bacterium]|nr:type II secretion system F family protein [Phycisphaerae bacterium]